LAETRLSASGIASVRSVAATALDAILSGASLTRLLASCSHEVDVNDRALLAELLFGSCRWYYRLDAVLARLMKKPLRKRDSDIHALIIIGLYQLVHMRIKPHAVLAETVNAARELGKPMFTRLVNGVLRGFQREQQSLLEQVDKNPAAAMAMPPWLLDDIRSYWPDRWQQIAQAMLEPPPLTLRLNTRRSSLAEYQELLLEQQMQAKPVDGIPGAVVLDKPVAVERIPGFSEGLVSVQDAGAQLAAMLLDVSENSVVLDACAAPGGKTGHILERADAVRLTAIDVDQQRLQKVVQNLERLQLQATLEVADAALPGGEWARQTYDFILLDVPCSATGVIRRHPDIKLLRRRGDIAGLIQQQRDILLNVWPVLKPGGRMLYATCSILSAENEQQIEWFLQQQRDAVEIPLQPQVSHHQRRHGVQLLPGESTTDGFYYALLAKKHDE
jgi:16S rRNA (cytosine967-C5)-methyltransferase